MEQNSCAHLWMHSIFSVTHKKALMRTQEANLIPTSPELSNKLLQKTVMASRPIQLPLMMAISLMCSESQMTLSQKRKEQFSCNMEWQIQLTAGSCITQMSLQHSNSSKKAMMSGSATREEPSTVWVTQILAQRKNLTGSSLGLKWASMMPQLK